MAVIIKHAKVSPCYQWSAIYQKEFTQINQSLTRWRDDGSVGNDYDWLFVLGLQFLQNLVSCLLERSCGPVEDSNEEVLGAGLVSVFVINELGAGDKNDAELLFQIGVVLLNLVKSLGHFLFEFRWLCTVFLDNLFSSIEHVCLSSKFGNLVVSLLRKNENE